MYREVGALWQVIRVKLNSALHIGGRALLTSTISISIKYQYQYQVSVSSIKYQVSVSVSVSGIRYQVSGISISIKYQYVTKFIQGQGLGPDRLIRGTRVIRVKKESYSIHMNHYAATNKLHNNSSQTNPHAAID
jgi:hypothetical protein